MKKGTIIVSVAWIIFILISLVWNITYSKKQNDRLIYKTAKDFFRFIVLTREWNARHGGVYVPITQKTKPNPYLKKFMFQT